MILRAIVQRSSSLNGSLLHRSCGTFFGGRFTSGSSTSSVNNVVGVGSFDSHNNNRNSYSSGRLSLRAFSNNSSDSDSDSDDDGHSSNNNSTTNILSSNNNNNSNSSVALLEEAPRLPHTLGLPVVSRPLFPGLVASITLHDASTIRALEQAWLPGNPTKNSRKQQQQEDGKDGNDTSSILSGETSTTFSSSASATSGSGNRKHQHHSPYVSCFLRKLHPTGVTEGGIILPTPEVITNEEGEIYDIGTYCQIQSITRSTGAATVNSGVPSTGPISSDDESNEESDDDDDNISATVILLAHRRVNLTSIDDVGPPLQVTVDHWKNEHDYYSQLTDNNKTKKEEDNNSDTIRALSNEIIGTIRKVAQVNPLFRENLQYVPMRIDANNPFRLADFAASICTATATAPALQQVLEERNAEQRLHLALQLLHQERQVSQLQQEIAQQVEEQMSQSQRKYFLTEQLKSIKKELGMEKDDKEALVSKYRQKLEEHLQIEDNKTGGSSSGKKSKKNSQSVIPQEAMETIEAELAKFETLERNSPEYNVTRSYLDWLILHMPWGQRTTERWDLRRARRILNAQHYGMDDVKDVILQFIAVGKLQQNMEQHSNFDTHSTNAKNGKTGKILCLSGPPGTGKTSIAQSVADSLGRKFFRFSVGGLSDVNEIKGHRRTYIGAMPGKLIQCLKTTGTTNPVVLIDEIDKLGGNGYRGDPSSALLEVLDPSQNSTFRDHFLDVPVDLSNILFICTANELERIPGPLLDRMEVIRLSGYDLPEKVAIAEQYLVPKSMRGSGLMYDPNDLKKEEESKESEQNAGQDSSEAKGAADDHEDEVIRDGTPLEHYVHSEGVPPSLNLTLGAITSLARWYAREAGVRNLAKYIDKITRTLALQVVAEEEGATLTEKSKRKSDTWEVSEDNLADYVGKPIFTSDRLYEDGPLPHGIVMGLAYTSMGGSALYIETQRVTRGLDSEGKPRAGGNLKVTGQLGDVMKESAQIAGTVARARLGESHPQNDFFDVNDMHMHVPEGATPKDGPSAGVTMVTSMLSLAMDRPIRNDLAMTGEISLTGKVLAVGGIKEKIMAARRAGIKCLVLPAANQRDFDEIPDYLKEDLEVHYADSYDKVYEVAFEGL